MITEKNENVLTLRADKKKVSRNFKDDVDEPYIDIKRSSNKLNYPQLILTFQLDTNCINARRSLPAITELERWAALGVIELEWSNAIEEELYRDAPNGIRFKKAISSRRIVANAAFTSIKEYQQLCDIKDIVFSGGVRNQRERNDLCALFTAWKYLAIFVTNDGSGRGKPRGILTHRISLEEIGVIVMSSTEALSFLYQCLTALADKERKISNTLGANESAWVLDFYKNLNI